MVYFAILAALILGLLLGCFFCPYRDDAMIKEAKKTYSDLKALKKEHQKTLCDYSEALSENARLNSKLSAKIFIDKSK